MIGPKMELVGDYDKSMAMYYHQKLLVWDAMCKILVEDTIKPPIYIVPGFTEAEDL